MIKITNVTKTFDKKKAIDKLSLSIGDGMTGLVGENGAGKSTLLRLISGVLYPDSGEIIIDDIPAEDVSSKVKLFFLPDDPYAPSGSYLKDLYDFYSCFYSVDKDEYFRILANFGLPNDKKISTFSKGMKRQAFIALSLAIDVKYLLLDEAFDGLDPLVLNKIRTDIAKKRAIGTSLLISSHNISTLERLATKTILLYKGKVRGGENKDLHNELVKYQIYTKDKITEDALKALNIKVVSLKSVGSIYHLVVYNEKNIEDLLKKEYKIILLEKIAMDPDELILADMELARMEDKDE
jgi:ABC-2 type transport system ATP-binding protein